MAKLGTYGIIRFDLSLFPHATRTLAPLFLTLAVIGIVYGAIVACAQRDMKRLVTYSSLAGIGFIALGTFSLSTQGLSGAVLLMLNHGIIVAGLFILIGFIYQRRGTWQTGELRGLQKAAPVMAAVFTVVMLASIGVPGLNGFVSEFLVLSGTFITHRWWAVVAMLGVIVAAIYLLWAYQQVFHGEPREADEKTRDLVLIERLVMAPLIILIVFLGVYPKPVLDRINPSVNQLIAHVESKTGALRAAGGGPRRGGNQVIAHLAAAHAAATTHAASNSITMPSIRWLAILPPIIMIGGAVVLLGLASLVRKPLRVRVSDHRHGDHLGRRVGRRAVAVGRRPAARGAYLREAGGRHGRLQRAHHHAGRHRHAARARWWRTGTCAAKACRAPNSTCWPWSRPRAPC